METKNYETEVNPFGDDYENINGVLAIALMHYLDQNRPSGKMCLSSMECKEIDDAFTKQDWATIFNYVKKFSPNSLIEQDAYDVYPIAPTPLGDDNRGLRLAYMEGCKHTIEKLGGGNSCSEDELAFYEPKPKKVETVPNGTVTFDTAKKQIIRSWVRSFMETLVWRKDFPYTKEDTLDSLD